MNKERRKQIQDVLDRLDGVMAEIETIASEERDYYDNMPENMKSGDKEQAASDAADALDQARDSVESAIDDMNNAISG